MFLPGGDDPNDQCSPVGEGLLIKAASMTYLDFKEGRPSKLSSVVLLLLRGQIFSSINYGRVI